MIRMELLKSNLIGFLLVCMSLNVSAQGKSDLSENKYIICECIQDSGQRYLYESISPIMDSVNQVSRIRKVSFNNVLLKVSSEAPEIGFTVFEFKGYSIVDLTSDTLFVLTKNEASIYFKRNAIGVLGHIDIISCESVKPDSNPLFNPKMKIKRLFRSNKHVYLGYQYTLDENGDWKDPHFSYLVE